VDLTPRTQTDLGGDGGAPEPAARRRKKGRRWLPAAVVAAVLVGGAVVLFQGLSNATVYFCNADQVGVKGGCKEGERFRLQGTVDDGSVVMQDSVVERFVVSYNGASIPVSYQGEPGGIFREGIPVVVEGRMGADGTFEGDRILVKHTSQYEQKNPDRVKDYPEGTGS
jgi:cytochrome c-type biogenesis protein CcmE